MYSIYVGNSRRAPTLNAMMCGIMFPMFEDFGTVINAFMRNLKKRIPTKAAPIAKNGKSDVIYLV